MKFTIRAHEIATLLDRLPAGVTTLSLDCFDTLLWRSVHAPHDVFVDLGLEGGSMPRIAAENAARRAAQVRGDRFEVTLPEIYRALWPGAPHERVLAGTELELAAEARRCFVFEPTAELIRAAKRRGLTVVIVSDMYLSEAELRALLARTAGPDLLALVDRVFMSSEYGRGKRHDLFAHVMRELGVEPSAILHVGDNQAADVDRPAELGIHTAHLLQFDAYAERRLRLEAAVAAMLDPSVRTRRPVHQPQRAAVALRRSDDPAYALGHDVLGPAMHAFAAWLAVEREELSARHGREVRPLFVMRDGHLPLQSFKRLFPDADARPVELSRAVATRASLFDDAGIDAFAERWLGKLSLDTLTASLMLTRAEADLLIGDRPERQARRMIREALATPDFRAKVMGRARGFGKKLAAHLRRAGVRPGDAVMLADLGYAGSVQNLLEPFLRDRLGLEVAGRYLLLRETELSGRDKRGFVDRRHYDDGVLYSLVACVAVLEQLCNVPQGSTIDFTDAGGPIRQRPDQKAAQSAVRERAQTGCLDYLSHASAGDDPVALRDVAVATLGRLLMLPIEQEAALFAEFDQDVNMGSDAKYKMLDRGAAERELRTRGFTYFSEAERIFIPAELRGQGLTANLALLASVRFKLDLRELDFAGEGLSVPVILLDATRQTVIDLTAHPTVDGFYRLIVPMGAGGLTAAVQLGRVCAWVQVASADYVRVADLCREERASPAVTMLDAMHPHGPDIHEAEEHGVLIAPALPASAENMALRLVFRPLHLRSAAAVNAATARAA